MIATPSTGCPPVRRWRRRAEEEKRRGRGCASLVFAFCLLSLGACAPQIASPGGRVEAPALAEDHVLTADGLRLPLRVWRAAEAPRAIILALHGFNDYSKSFERSAKAWAAEGFTVYAFDQRGFGAAPNHGLWPGAAALTGDLALVCRLLRARYPGTRLYLIGESMGAAVIMAAFANGDRPAADGVVLSAPAIWSRRFMPAYQRAALWLGAHTAPWLTLTGQGLDIQASDNIEMLRELGRDPLVIKETRIDAMYGLTDLMDAALAAAPRLDLPALILYGREEQLIPGNARRALLDALPRDGPWRHAEYSTGYHMLLRDLNADIVLRDIADWIGEAAAAPRTGAETTASRRNGRK